MYDGVGVAVGGAGGVDVAVGGADGVGVTIGGPGIMWNQNRNCCRRENLDTQPQGSPWSLLVLLDTNRHFCRKPEP